MEKYGFCLTIQVKEKRRSVYIEQNNLRKGRKIIEICRKDIDWKVEQTARFT